MVDGKKGTAVYARFALGPVRHPWSHPYLRRRHAAAIESTPQPAVPAGFTVPAAVLQRKTKC